MEINVNNTFFTGKFLVHLPSVDSTNNYAKQHLAKSSPIDGTVILADEQFAGRGQTGNIWLSESDKNLTFSIIYQTGFLMATEQFYLNIAVSLGVWSMVNSQCSIKSNIIPSTKIKWPNDIYINNKKIAGILIENTIYGMHLKYSIVGIGLNVNQTNFPESINATSLNLTLNKELNKIEILNQLLSSIEKYFLLLRERKLERLKSEYLVQLFRYNEIALYKNDNEIFEGKIIDVDESGKLIMTTNNGIKSYHLKEISFVV